ncbi:MAG: HD domain-containing protein [Bacteroidaceae bacterium]
MKEETIEFNKNRYLEICRETIKRDGLEDLLAYLEKSDFFRAPSSRGFHLNEDGGLCKHSLNVFEAAMAIYQRVLLPKIENGEAVVTEKLSEESLAIATLFHDLCKVNIYHKAERWKKDEKGRWQSYNGYELKDNFPFGHGEKSCIMIHWYLKLKQEELLAIRWHMGMFEATEQGSITRFAFRDAMAKSPLVAIVQAADMLAANCLEKTNEL